MKKNDKRWTDLKERFEEQLREELLSHEKLSEIFNTLSKYKDRGLLNDEEYQRNLELGIKLFEAKISEKQLATAKKQLATANEQLATAKKQAEDSVRLKKYAILAALLASTVAALVGFKEELMVLLKILGQWFGTEFVEIVESRLRDM